MKKVLSYVAFLLVVLCASPSFAGEAEFIKAVEKCRAATEVGVSRSKLADLCVDAKVAQGSVKCDSGPRYLQAYCKALDGYVVAARSSYDTGLIAATNRVVDAAREERAKAAGKKKKEGANAPQ